MLRAALYARVSSAEQATPNHTSLDQQLADTRRLAVERGYEVVLTERDVLTGLEPERRGYRVILDAARRGLIDVVLAWKWDRWGRDAAESIAAHRELGRLGVLVESYMEPGTTDFMQGIFALVAEQSSRDTSQRTTAALRERAGWGAWLGGRAPFGYRRVRVQRGGRSVPVLEPDPSTAPELRALFADAATGRHSARHLITLAYQRGYFDPVKRPLDRNHVVRILRNPVYRGAVVYGRQSRSRFRKQGRMGTDTWTVVEDAHPALVTRDQWDAVQAWLTEHQRDQGTVRGTVYLLTSVLWCGRCGGKMYGRTHRAPGGRLYQAYSCARRSNAAACDMPSLTPAPLEAAVRTEIVAQFTVDAELRAAVAQVLEAEAAEEAGTLVQRRRQLERRKADHERNRRDMLRRYLAIGGSVDKSVYDALDAEEVQAIRVIERALDALPAEPPRINLQARLNEIAGLNLADLDAAGWRRVVVLLVERIAVHGKGDYTVTWRPEAETVRRAVATLTPTGTRQQQS